MLLVLYLLLVMVLAGLGLNNMHNHLLKQLNQLLLQVLIVVMLKPTGLIICLCFYPPIPPRDSYYNFYYLAFSRNTLYGAAPIPGSLTS